jgi:glyoxylase-like metal-dependent hydrolase (beta-lactamase superfamily II)
MPFEVTDDVYGIDVELFDSGVVSVYLFDDEEPTLVEAGTAKSADRIMDGIAACGVDPTDLEHLVLSHIHVDHSGAASALVDANPQLDVYIHEMTAPHLASPENLIESSRRAMGEHFETMGEQGSVPEDSIVEVPDEGASIDIGDNTLELHHEPGHSPDHLAVWNPERDLLFAAECLGLQFTRVDQWIPPATMPNFDVAQVRETIDDLRALDPEQIIFSHFGAWEGDAAEAFEKAETELARFEERILEIHDDSDSRAETREIVGDELIDISPPYDDATESFYARLVTDGYLKYHDIE